MHPTLLVTKKGEALERLVKASELIGERYQLDPALVSALEPKTKEPKVREMQRIQAVADLLEAICIAEGLMSAEPVVTSDDADKVESSQEQVGDTGEEMIEDSSEEEVTSDEGVTTETGADADDLPEPVVISDEADEGQG